MIIQKIQQWNLEENNIEEYISLLSDGKKLIMIKGYDSKFRRLFLNTNEFFISSLILLILFNLFVKNYKKILKYFFILFFKFYLY